MCGRFTLTADPADLQESFYWVNFGNADITPRYNIAPTQGIPVVTNDGSNKLDFFTWGLVPFWAKDPSIGSRMINARAETLAEKRFQTPALPDPGGWILRVAKNSW